MDKKKVPEVKDVQEPTGKNDAVESVFPDTANREALFREMFSRFKKSGLFKETKPVSRIDFWGEEAKAIRKIAREMSRRNV